MAMDVYGEKEKLTGAVAVIKELATLVGLRSVMPSQPPNQGSTHTANERDARCRTLMLLDVYK